MHRCDRIDQGKARVALTFLTAELALRPTKESDGWLADAFAESFHLSPASGTQVDFARHFKNNNRVSNTDKERGDTFEQAFRDVLNYLIRRIDEDQIGRLEALSG